MMASSNASLPTLAPRLPGIPPPSVERPSPKEHSEAEWEAKRPLIEKLYIVDHRKLNETMAILETKHGFAATEQMYKKRLRKWNIRKRTYRKVRDSSAAPSVATSISGTSTPPPPPPPVIATASTAKADNTAIVDDTVPVETIEEVLPLQSRQEVERNPSLALVQQLSGMKPFIGLEIVLSGVSNWSQGKIDGSLSEATAAVSADPMSRYLAAPNQPPIQDSRTMYRTFELVFDLWGRGRGDLAGMAARKAFFVLEYVLTEDHPDLVWHILDTVYDMLNKGHLQLLRMFLEHSSALARRKLPAQHPLVLILDQLRRCDYQSEEGRQQMMHLLRTAWLRNVDVLGDQIGSLAPGHLWLYEQLIWDGRTRLRRDSELWRRREAIAQALSRLSAAIAEQEHAGNPETDSERLRVKALMLEFTQMDLGDKEKAEILARSLLHDTENSNAVPVALARSNDRFHAYARKMLARLNAERHDWSDAENNIKLAIDRRETAHGTADNIRVVRDMWVLASHYRKVGRHEDADLVVEDAIGRAQRYLEDIPG